LEVLEAPLAELEARLASGDDAAAALRRQHLDAFVQLAWALPAEPPSAVGRQRLLSRLQGDETVQVARPTLVREEAAAPPAAGHMGVLDPPAPPQPASGPRAVSSRGGAAVPTVGPGVRRPATFVPPVAPRRSYGWA